MMKAFSSLLTINLACLLAASLVASTQSFLLHSGSSLRSTCSQLRMGIEDGNVTIIEKPERPEIQDDLTDRFKYKVHALMGDFNPPEEVDNENETGTILGAMMSFPSSYSFNAVGKTEGDTDKQDEFVKQVVAVVTKSCGGGNKDDDDDVVVKVTPRGTKFTKVSIQATVESAAMITEIYKELEKNEACVMSF